ncbi:unnamed protein product, partial [Acidithrix sp. C25]
VPVTIYGKGSEPRSIAVPARELNALVIHRKLMGAILEIEIDGKPQTTLVKDIQRHPVRRSLLHMDLQLLSANQEVVVTVTLVAGEGVELELDNLEVSGPTSEIPATIDVGPELLVDGMILASALGLPAKVTLLTPSDTVVGKEAGLREAE